MQLSPERHLSFVWRPEERFQIVSCWFEHILTQMTCVCTIPFFVVLFYFILIFFFFLVTYKVVFNQVESYDEKSEVTANVG